MPGLFDDLIPQGPGKSPEMVVGGAAAVPVGEFDDLIPEQPSVGKDIAQTVPAAIARGVAAIPGIPGDIQRLKDAGVDWLGRKAAKLLTGKDFPSTYELDEQNRLPGSQRMIEGLERATGPLYKPKTVPGEYANTIGEFLPGSLIGAPMRLGGAAAQALKFGVAPGIFSETAGQATKGTEMEPYARLGGAVAGGIPGALMGLRKPAPSVVGEAGRGVTDEQWRAAQSLMDDAAGRGMTLTGPQAIQYATGGGTRFGDLARVLERSEKGGSILNPMMSEIPATNRNAMMGALDEIAPSLSYPEPPRPIPVQPLDNPNWRQPSPAAPPENRMVPAYPMIEGPQQGTLPGGVPDVVRGPRPQPARGPTIETPNIPPQDNRPPMSPYDVAPRTQRAAQGAVDQTRRDINAEARPFYDAARNEIVPDERFRSLSMGNTPSAEAFREALAEVRGDPIIAATVRDLPDNAVGVLDEVKKRLDAMHKRSSEATKPDLRRAELIDDARKSVIDLASEVSPYYREALRIGSDGRQGPLASLKAAPTGQLANTDKFEKQASILFNPNPLPGSERDIARAVREVASADPEAARALVRMKLEQTFNEATQRLQAGENQWGGAKYAAVIRGNPQQAQNLEAAVRALPDGDAAWNGFRRVLDVFEAQGTRQPAGSQTAFNVNINEELKGGKPIGEIAALVATPKRWPAFIGEWYQNFRYGKNTGDAASIFTSPDAIQQMRALSGLDRNSQAARQIVAKIVVGSIAANAPERSRGAGQDLPRPNQ